MKEQTKVVQVQTAVHEKSVMGRILGTLVSGTIMASVFLLLAFAFNFTQPVFIFVGVFTIYAVVFLTSLNFGHSMRKTFLTIGVVFTILPLAVSVGFVNTMDNEYNDMDTKIEKRVASGEIDKKQADEIKATNAIATGMGDAMGLGFIAVFSPVIFIVGVVFIIIGMMVGKPNKIVITEM